MSTFEFVSVLLSIVVSLGLTHLLTAIARMLQAKGMKFSFALAGWICVALFTCIDYWFSLWQARETAVWSLGYVGLWLAAATSIYLFAWMVVPDGKLDGVDLRVYHHENRRKFLPLYAGYIIAGLFINLSVDAFKDLVNWSVVIWFIPVALAWVWANKWVQFIALAWIWAMLGLYAVQFLGSL